MKTLLSTVLSFVAACAATGLSGQVIQVASVYSFDAPSSPGINTDGQTPGMLVDGGDGYLYGACASGGSLGAGTLYRITYAGTGFTVLHDFGGAPDGQNPQNGLIVRGTTLYGVTVKGGTTNNFGTVYKIGTNGTGYQVIHNQILSDGISPQWIALSPDGTTLLVVTTGGGPSGAATGNQGTVFALPVSATTSTPVTVLHAFSNISVSASNSLTNSDGAIPTGVIFSPDGTKVYGATQSGGSNGSGTVYAITVATEAFAVLHTFSALSSGTNADGAAPSTGPVISSDGTTLFGVAKTGGTGSYGTVYSIVVSSGTFTTLNSFTLGATDGGEPIALSLSGNTVYGVNEYGGSAGEGTLWQFPFGTQSAASAGGTRQPDEVTGSGAGDNSRPAASTLSVTGPSNAVAPIGGTASFGVTAIDTIAGVFVGTIFYESLDETGSSFPNFTSFYYNIPIVNAFIYGAINGGGANGAGQIIKAAIPVAAGTAGTPSVSYQWIGSITSDGMTPTNITGATSSTLALTGVLAGSLDNVFGGTFGGIKYYAPVRCQVTDSNGGLVNSATAIIGVPPYFIQQPVSQTVNGLDQQANFSVTVGGSMPITLQWFQDGEAITGATGKSLQTNGGVTNFFSSLGTLFFIGCTATNAYGTANSAAVELNVNPVVTGGTGVSSPSALPPTVNQQPASQTVPLGSNATFTVGAAGSSPAYQWYFDALGATQPVAVAGATGASLTVNGVTAGNLGFYYCVVSNLTAQIAISSYAGLFTTGGQPPTITQQPANQTVNDTLSVIPSTSFSVTATGTAPLTYQWYFETPQQYLENNSFMPGPGAGGESAISGSNSASLTVAFSEFGVGYYTCVVSNQYGSAQSSAASLGVTQGLPQITTPPQSQTVAAGSTVTFAVVGGRTGYTYYWYGPSGEVSIDNPNAVSTTTSTGSTLVLSNVDASDTGNWTCTVVDPATGIEVDTAPAVLQVNTGTGPALQTQPAAAGAAPISVVSGGTVALNALASTGTQSGSSAESGGRKADAATAVTYQWQLDGQNIQGAVTSLLVISNASAANAGTYNCIATSSGGSTASNPVTLSIDTTASDLANPGRLINVSCRAQVGTGSNVLIAGLVVGGAGTSGSESLLLRASGPALVPFGVTGTLPDPQLTLNSTGGVIATNSGWSGNATVASTAAAVGAFPWTSTTSHDAALVESAPVGAYTAEVSGQSGDTGVSLVEVYDATPAGAYTPTTPRLINISTRVQVGTGANVLIAGFVVGGSTSKTVLIRASGPALTPLGVAGALSDPELQLSNPGGTIAINTGWGGNPQIAATAASVGAFSWGTSATADSALLVTLPPGSYTAEVSGASGDTGVSLIEVYEVP